MIDCPHCHKEMRNVFEFSDDFKDYKVCHCWDCDLSIILNADTEKVEWTQLKENRK